MDTSWVCAPNDRMYSKPVAQALPWADVVWDEPRQILPNQIISEEPALWANMTWHTPSITGFEHPPNNEPPPWMNMCLSGLNSGMTELYATQSTSWSRVYEEDAVGQAQEFEATRLPANVKQPCVNMKNQLLFRSVDATVPWADLIWP